MKYIFETLAGSQRLVHLCDLSGQRSRGLWADVAGARPDDLVVGGLLKDVCRPANDPTHREARREHRRWQTGEMQDNAGIELNVGHDHRSWLPAAQYGKRAPLDFDGPLHKLTSVLERPVAKQQRARVFRSVDGMPEPHEFVAPIEALSHPPLGVRGITDVFNHAERSGRRTTVQRTGECTDASAQSAHHISTGAGHDSGGKGRGIEPVVDGRREVGLDERGPLRRGGTAGGETKPVGGVPERSVREKSGLRSTSSTPHTKQRWRRCSEANDITAPLIRRCIEGGCDRAEHEREQRLERHVRLGDRSSDTARVLQHIGIELASGSDFGAEDLLLVGRRKRAVEHEEPGSFERAMTSDLGRVVLAVVEEPLGTADGADGGVSDLNSLEARWNSERRCRSHAPTLANRRTLINVDFINVDSIYASRVPNDAGLLTAAEAAARLGVKRETLYAYVSRGVLQRTLSLDGRTSLFDPAEVDGMRATRRKPSDGEITTVIASSITRVEETGLRYRDVPVADLLDHRFESVADLLWERTGPWSLEANTIEQLHRVRDALPADTPLLDRMRVSTATLSAIDPLRNDASTEAVCRTGRRILLGMIESIPLVEGAADPGDEGGIAARLWPRLTAQSPIPERIAVLNAALIALADHGLAASTYAARIATSVRADPYSVVLTGLGAVAGLLHGFASGGVYQLVQRAEDRGAESALAEVLARSGDRVPGTGHSVYRGVDPREAMLMERITAAYADDPRLETALELRALVSERLDHLVNVDFPLGVFSWLGDMGDRGGECIFLARTVGWIAHSIEERSETPVRFRPQARYVRPGPSDLPERSR